MENLYEYKGNKYNVLGEVLMKDFSSGEWMKAVMYKKRYPIERGETFVREREDFYSKFTKYDPAPSDTGSEL